MSRSFICPGCKERKRPVDPEHTKCKACRPETTTRSYHSFTAYMWCHYKTKGGITNGSDNS